MSVKGGPSAARSQCLTLHRSLLWNAVALASPGRPLRSLVTIAVDPLLGNRPRHRERRLARCGPARDGLAPTRKTSVVAQAIAAGHLGALGESSASEMTRKTAMCAFERSHPG